MQLQPLDVQLHCCALALLILEHFECPILIESACKNEVGSQRGIAERCYTDL